ncbi:S-adenosyl-L-methionine-dependent methyltransferase [Aspergillus nidulans var. acristatus]
MPLDNEIPRHHPNALIGELHALSEQLTADDNHETKRTPQSIWPFRYPISSAVCVQIPANFPKPVLALSARIAIELTRILRLLATAHFVEETSAGTWAPTPITKTMAKEEIAAGYRFISHMVVPALQSAPGYFQRNGFACPTDTKDGLVQHALRTKKTSFEYIMSDPLLLRDFNLFMGNGMGARKSWLDWYPVQSEILDGADADPDKVLIVDVGGGKGHDLIAFHKKFPSARRLILEDLPAALDDLGEYSMVIEKIGHDFLTEDQPVKGARAYLCHHILHDWPDNYCLRILEGISSAMAPGYSRLLLHEGIVPEKGACQFQAMSDIAAMACNGGMERTAQQWRTLLQTAGLQLVRFWNSPDEGGDGIIEAVKV